MVKSRIVQNDYHLTAPATPGDNPFQEFKKGFCAKLISVLPVETSVRFANSSKHGNAFSGWGVQ